MNREIKFRAWDTKGKQIVDHEEMMMDCDGFMAIDEEGTEFPMDVIMQYTGLKDKNGKEIYEGDIVEFKIYPEFENEKEIDIFDEIQFRGGCFILKNRIELLRTRLPNIKVIGNIYENPNLLK